MAPDVLKCPGCGASLATHHPSEALATCEFCGSQVRLGPKINAAVADLVVQREIQEQLGRARHFAEQRLFDRALELYDRVLELDPDQQLAWLGKAHCAEDRTTIREYHLPEAYQCFQRAIETAPGEDERRWVRQRILQQLPDRIRQHHEQLHALFAQFANERASLDEALHDYQLQLRAGLAILARLQNQFPDEPSIPGTVVEITRRAQAGLRYSADQSFDLPDALRTEIEQAGQTAAQWLAARNPQNAEPEPTRAPEGGSAAGFTPGWWFALALFLLALAGAAAWALLTG